MTLPAPVAAALAAQLREPHGPAGPLLGPGLDRGNRRAIVEGVTALRPRPGEVVADLGFGGGLGLARLLAGVGPAGLVHGVERSVAMLTLAARRFRPALTAGTLALHGATILRLPFPDASLDAALTVHTLYFLDDPEPACREWARVLRPHGRLVLVFGDPVAMTELPFTAYGFRLRPVATIVDAVRAAGLRVTTHHRAGHGAHEFHVLCARPCNSG
ncbi:methyltransferase domain-containing protein [Nocardia terpenica]|uniref:class I SAM-dependent methyltransferase n=1 Tax=Nocardia terpenica TaxID=455432 RepID=UPI002FE22C90